MRTGGTKRRRQPTTDGPNKRRSTSHVPMLPRNSVPAWASRATGGGHRRRSPAAPPPGKPNRRAPPQPRSLTERYPPLLEKADPAEGAPAPPPEPARAG